MIESGGRCYKDLVISSISVISNEKTEKQPSKNRRKMNILNNRNKRTNIFKAVALCLIAAVSFTLVSCDDDMDIQQSYPFTVEVMPVPNKVTKGQTVEIRCELKKEGDFANTLYTITCFSGTCSATYRPRFRSGIKRIFWLGRLLTI